MSIENGCKKLSIIWLGRIIHVTKTTFIPLIKSTNRKGKVFPFLTLCIHDFDKKGVFIKIDFKSNLTRLRNTKILKYDQKIFCNN